MGKNNTRFLKKLGIGSAQFGLNYGVTNKNGKSPQHEIKKLLHTAKTHSIDLIDTAVSYGNAEEVLGSQNISTFNVITKLPKFTSTEIEPVIWLNQTLNKSLSNMAKKQLYGLLLHHPRDTILNKILLEEFLRLRETKRVYKIGVSVYCPKELEDIIKVFKPDIVQLPYNIIDRRFAETGWLKELAHNNIEIHARSVFLQGLLLTSHGEQVKRFPNFIKLWESWATLQKSTSRTASDLAISFALNSPFITRAIVGFETNKQLLEICKLSFDFPDIDMDKTEYNNLNLIDPRYW